jgi:di/tripeptidase
MATEVSVLSGLEPRSFWGHFEALTKIARPSRHEEPVIQHVRAWAEQHGSSFGRMRAEPESRVPATPGRWPP